MRAISCAKARASLTAYRDGELDVRMQIAMRAHLAACATCAAEADALAALGEVIRQASIRRVERMTDVVGSVHARVVARVAAEQPRRSTARRLRDFDDGHLLWAGAGATVATLFCILALLGVVRMSLREAPSSLAAVLGAMADPGSNRNPMILDARVLLPRADPAALMPSPLLKPSEGWLALSAVVTREGLVRDVVLLPTSTHGGPGDQDVLDVLDAAAQTRFEPARAGGEPVAVNVVWLLAHTTVVGNDRALPLVPATPAVRRTAAPRSHGVPVSSRRPPQTPALA
jgi:Putative zinc-finger